MNLFAVMMGKTSSDDIASTSYNCAPTEHQPLLWRLRKLCSNQLHCAVPKSSFSQSVFLICPCIQLHQYACNVLQIWFFGFWILSQYLRTRSLVYCNLTFGSISSWITQLSNSYPHVGFKIFEHVFARGYEVLLRWTCLDSSLEGAYFTNRFRYLVGFNESKLEVIYWLE